MTTEPTTDELRERIEKLDWYLTGDTGPLQDLLHMLLNRIVALEKQPPATLPGPSWPLNDNP